MKILVCGGRDYDDQGTVDEVLGALNPSIVVHGDYRGADTLADNWAHENGVTIAAYPANWDRHGPAAGPIRNQTMLDEEAPDMVVAFPGGRGTEDMVSRAHDAGITVLQVKRSPHV